MEEEVKRIIEEQLGVKVGDLKDNLRDDLGADSLDLVELTMALEEKFDIEIMDEDAEKLLKVGDVVEYIEEHQKKEE